MKVLFEVSNEMWTGQIVLREDGKYVVRHEGVLTCPAWDRAGINGPYWETIAVCDTFDEAKAVVVEDGWPGTKKLKEN